MNNPIIDIIEKDTFEISSKINFKELDGKSILITGASGLIGTYLLATLKNIQDNGLAIKVFAVIQSEFPSYLSKFGESVDFLKGDLTKHDFLRSLPDADYIIHAAGYGQPGKFMENPIKTIELNTTCANELVKKLKLNGKFLFISTSEVYSGLPNPPYKEEEIGTTNTTHPRSCYIEGKRCGEAIVNAYRQLGINAKSARLSLAYGPGTKPGDARVINSFIYKGLKDGKITLMDMGEAKRTYCYVQDAVEVLWHILLKGSEPIYNVGGNSHTTIAELAQKVADYLKVPVIFPETQKIKMIGAPDNVALDMTKSKQEFNKVDFTSLDDGLAKTIEWQRSLYDIIK